MAEPTLVELFQSQLSTYYEMAKAERVDLGSKAGLGAALAFAEYLLLCPTADAAKAQMLQGPEVARSFLQVAMAVDDLLSSSDTATLKPPPKDATPFFVLASAVQEYLRHAKDQFPDDW